MKIAIIGLPQSGRTSLWQTLARGHIGKKDNIAMVKIPDERLLKIAELISSKKVTHIEIELHDTIGDITRGGSIYSEIQGVDGLIIVIRGFDGGFGAADPVADAQKIIDSLIITDASIVETRIKTLVTDIQKGRSPDERRIMERDLVSFRKFAEILDSGKLLRDFELSQNDKKLLANHGFHTGKPWLIIINTEDTCDVSGNEKIGKISGSSLIGFPVKLVTEIDELEPDEADAFCKELGIPENIVDRTILHLKDALGLIEFYTGNDKEARAWTIPVGTIAQEAAGKIHTDIARGFIRAEIIKWDKLIEAGGYVEARAKAFLRIEGKEYVMQDGDYVAFRFNV